MINNHMALFASGAQGTKQIDYDEKKMVKMFIYQNPETWIQYIKGVLILGHDHNQNLLLKIRLICKTHLPKAQKFDFLPFHFQSDEEGYFLNIKEEIIDTIDKSDENVIYLKLKIEQIVIALSFLNKTYCLNIYEQILIEADEEQVIWQQNNLTYLVNQTLDWTFNKMMFTDQQKIKEFCNFIRSSIKQKKIDLSTQKIQINQNTFQSMNPFFKIAKNLSFCFDKDILQKVTENEDFFQCLLICYSFNPFGTFHYNYLVVYQNTLKINNHLDIQNQEIIKDYLISIKAKFLKDVVLCTFSQIPTEGNLSQLINQMYVNILKTMTKSDTIFSDIVKLSNQNSQHFIYIFIELWQIFKAVLQDIETRQIKNLFYVKWIKNHLFDIVLSVFSRFVGQKQSQIQNLNSRIWQRFIQSMNPMLSYDWINSQDIILAHYQKKQNIQKDLMTTLIKLVEQCEFHIKIIILDFVKCQIQTSDNRKVIKERYLSYIFNKFVVNSFKTFQKQELIQKFLQFIIAIYEAQPIRTRQSIIQKNLFQILKKFENNKYVFIMVIKLFKKFVQSSENKDIFVYLSNRNFFISLRQKYAIYQHSKNIINSLFLNLFKTVQNSTSSEGKKYIYHIFFPDQNILEIKDQIQKEQKKQEQDSKYKRPLEIIQIQQQIRQAKFKKQLQILQPQQQIL